MPRSKNPEALPRQTATRTSGREEALALGRGMRMRPKGTRLRGARAHQNEKTLKTS